MITIRNLSKSFENKLIFDNFNAELKPGLIYGLMGPSGCGKTTLLRLLARLEGSDSGEISGLEAEKMSFVFQDDRLIEGYSTLRNAELPLTKGDPAGKMWLERLELGDDISSLPRELSGGMRRRVALARALAYGGDVFFMDEPFAGIDRETRERIIPMIKNSLAGKTSFIATHDPIDAALLCDMVIRLSDPPQRAAQITSV